MRDKHGAEGHARAGPEPAGPARRGQGAAGSAVVSVVLPVRDGAATIEAQLAALAAQTHTGAWELVVVDNGSTDGTWDLVTSWRRRLPRLRLVEGARARGANDSRNRGCREARGDLLLFCDHDDVVDQDWVAAMAKGLARYHAVGGFVERELLNDAVALATRPQRTGLLDSFSFLPYPLLANAGVRREAWEALGGFDPTYRHGSDDVEFFWRAQLAGYRLGYVPDAVVHYRLRGDIAGMARQYYVYGRSHPRLFRSFGPAGMPPSGWRCGALAWWRLAASAGVLVRSPRDRAVWLTRAAMRCGRLAGSVRHRAVYL